MAWFPSAIRKPIARHDTAIVGPRRYTLHTAVSAGSSLFNYFNQPGNPTSHFYVRADGTVEQYVSTAHRAPAQLEGNHDTVSVESQDMGGPFPSWSGSNVPAWTAAQMESLARIGAWLHKTHRIKLQLCPNSKPGTEGFAYHRQGIDPWRVSGGELWSKAYGKVCPGDRRVKQVPTVLSRAKQIVGGEEDDVLTDDDKQWLASQMMATMKTTFTGQSVIEYNGEKYTRDAAQELFGGFAGKTLNEIRYRVLPELAAIREAQGGEPVDTAVLAAELAALLLPQVREGIRAELEDVDGVNEDAVADAVVAKIGAALTAAIDAPA